MDIGIFLSAVLASQDLKKLCKQDLIVDYARADSQVLFGRTSEFLSSLPKNPFHALLVLNFSPKGLNWPLPKLS